MVLQAVHVQQMYWDLTGIIVHLKSARLQEGEGGKKKKKKKA